MMPAHVLVAGKDVLEGAGQYMMNSGFAIRGWRSVIPHEQRFAFALFLAFDEHVVVVPEFENLLLKFRSFVAC